MEKLTGWICGALRGLAREKVAGRAAFAAVAHYLVAAGLVDAGDAEYLEVVGLAVLDLALVLGARRKVAPDDEVEELRAALREEWGDQRE